MANTKVTAKVIADGTITATQIANDAVTGAKIADDVALGGNPTTTTQSAGNNTTRIATTAFVTTAVDNLIDSAPGALNTLNELAAALGDDASFSTTITNSIATKLPLAGGTMSGALNMGSQNITNAGDISGGILTAETSSDYPLRVKSTDGFSGIVIEDNSSTSNGNVVSVTGDTMNFFTGGTSSTTDIALSLASDNDATFNGDVNVFGANRKLAIGESGGGGTFGFVGWDDTSNYLYIGNSYSSAFNKDIVIKSDGKVGIGKVTSPYFPLHVQGENLANGAAKNLALFFDTSSATTGTGGGIALGGYSNGTGGETYHFGNIQGIKENSTAGDYASAMLFSTRANGATPTEKMRILSTGQITTGGLTSTTAALHLYSDNTWSGILTLQSQAAANATAQIAFMSRDSSNVNDFAYIKYDQSGNATKNQIDLYPSNNRTLSVSHHGSLTYGDEGSNLGIGKFIGSVAPHNTGNRYVHIQISNNYNEMVHIFVHGYSYTSALIEGSCAFYFYNNANQTTLYDFRSSGSIVGGYCNSSNNYAEIVIDTLTTATTNRWGNISVYGGQDNIISYHHTEIVQVAYSGANSRYFT